MSSYAHICSLKWRTLPIFNKTELEMHRIQALWSLSGTHFWIAVGFSNHLTQISIFFTGQTTDRQTMNSSTGLRSIMGMGLVNYTLRLLPEAILILLVFTGCHYSSNRYTNDLNFKILHYVMVMLEV